MIDMNTWKRIAAALLAGAMMVPAIACSHDSSSGTDTDSSKGGVSDSGAENSNGNDSSQGGEESSAGSVSLVEDSNVHIDENQLFQYDLDFAEIPADQSDDDDPQEPTNFIVTTMRGDDGQVYVPKTDINGTTVTEEGGAPVTEVYTGTTLATTYAEPAYEPDYKNHQAFWLDMSQQADFVFDGELLVYKLKIADDAVDGVYPIQYYFTDIANWDANTVKDVTLNVGYVCINAEAPAADQPTGAGLTINPGTVTAKPGDTVELPINIVNNPGFVGFRLRMRYDSKAMTIVDAGAGKDLHSQAGMTAREIGED